MVATRDRLEVVVGRLLPDRRDAEEAVQDTYVQAWRHRDRFRAEAAVSTWLHRIATNTALMRLRRHRPPLVGLDELDPAHDPLADRADQLCRTERVGSALAALPAHHRRAVVLRDLLGLSNAEAAETLGLPVTTVKAHLHRGRVALRRSLADLGSERSGPVRPG